MENGRGPYQIEVPYSVTTLDLATVPYATPNPSVPSETLLRLSDVGTVVAAQAALDGKQPIDETLTALAGQDWALDAIPIGTGGDTLAQTVFAANTFPGKASTGALVAKPLTDFGLSLLDDADAATARSTLGLPTFAHGTYTPTVTGTANVDTVTTQVHQYLRVGNTVTVSGRSNVDPTAAASTFTTFTISLPIASNFTATGQCAGAGAAAQTPQSPALISGDTTNDVAVFGFNSSGTTSVSAFYTFTYLVL